MYRNQTLSQKLNIQSYRTIFIIKFAYFRTYINNSEHSELLDLSIIRSPLVHEGVMITFGPLSINILFYEYVYNYVNNPPIRAHKPNTKHIYVHVCIILSLYSCTVESLCYRLLETAHAWILISFMKGVI